MSAFDYTDSKRWFKVPIHVLEMPKDGYLCFGPSWWAVTEDRCVLFFKSPFGSPQANANQSVVQRVHPTLKTEFISMAFIPHRCSDYV